MALNPTPEEQELSAKLEEQARLDSLLVQKELDLATLLAEVQAFNSRYMHSVGRLYAELDAIQGEIAERRAKLNPKDSELRRQAADARQRASDSANAVNAAASDIESFQPTDEIKQLYRSAARRYHPDRALDEVDRLRRTELMSKINVAYQHNDLAGLERILADAGTLPEDIVGDDVGAKLIRAIRRIAQISNRLKDIEREIQSAKTDAIYQLKVRVETEEANGGNPLVELAKQVSSQIEAARRELHGSVRGDRADSDTNHSPQKPPVQSPAGRFN